MIFWIFYLCSLNLFYIWSFVWCNTLHNPKYLDKPVKCLEMRLNIKSKWYFSRVFQPNTPLSRLRPGGFTLKCCNFVSFWSRTMFFTYKCGRIVSGLQLQQNTPLIWPVLGIPSKNGYTGPSGHTAFMSNRRRKKGKKDVVKKI